MQRSAQLFKSESLLQNNLHLLVNRYAENFFAPYHSHDFIEYCYVAEGRGFHHIDQAVIPVRKGMLFVIPVGVSHVFRPATSHPEQDRLIVYNCLFDDHMVDRLSALLQEESPIIEHLQSLGSRGSAYFSVSDWDGSIEKLMLNLHREMSVPGIGSVTMLQTLLSQLIVTVYRQLYADQDRSTIEASDFAQVILFMEQKLSEGITLTHLAQMSRWSSRHLQRMFLKHTCQSFGSYLQHLRIQKSCERLRTSDLKISMIAESVGYRDIDTFNSVFKKIVGEPPMAYRKRHRT
ncbi:helix-turn-helix domain-containing protein [Paenibacillus sp. sgz500992]|uniref:helix-turn-helix domain-containing protein n=1 Tax=Paenibacillus sp. sgz500992 TaxID=3242476 RepID=UPI0036D40E0C